MGKIIISNDYISVANAQITARTAEAAFPKVNVMDYWHLNRRFRAADVITNDYLLKFDLSNARSVVGVFLNDVNFDTVKLQADTDDTWAAGMVEDSVRTVSQNPITGRYQIYCPFSFTKRYHRLFIPTGTVAVGDYVAKWEVGSVVVLDSVIEFTVNMSYGYKEGGSHFYEDHVFPGGGMERSELGSLIQWWGEAVFGARTTTNEAQLWTINRYRMSVPLVFYVNDGNSYKAYLCSRDTEYESTLIFNQVVQGNTIRFTELI